MAKQVGFLKITGCYDDICFYKMDGEYYARMKSSLTGKRVKKDPAFKRTMEYAGLLARASKMASSLYKTFPQEKKVKGAYKKLVGQVMQWLKEGKMPLPATEVKTNKKVLSKRVVLKTKPQRIAFGDDVIEKIFTACFARNEREMEPAPS